MRYVRPPVDDKSTPLFPLRPGTRPLRLGIDVETVPEPPDGYLTGFLTRDEIQIHLLMPQGQEQPPEAWSRLLHKPILPTMNFTTAAGAGAVEIDGIVTNRTTANRTDVGDNDIVIAVTPDDAVALIGHYLRVTSNPMVNVTVRPLVGDGTLTTTESTETIVN